ncbi:MAG: chorismate-binding protein, partial [Planctomycetota bacterium]
VNLAHELGGASDLGVRATGLGLLDASDACFGAYLERPDGSAVASASPELFLAFDARTRRLVTRPMKGTRDGAGDAEELRTAEKDRAELNMIVDLMRNDIGRVARCGSVEVELERSIETHGARDASVHQATATVSGELRGGLDVVDALTAAFPPGSVTGAPKVRAMQLIEELEGFGRGVYCGAIGYLSRCGGAAFSVAIRTADVRPAAGGGSRLRFPVGAGIVSDSRPDAEWDETLVKSASLRAALGVERVVGP